MTAARIPTDSLDEVLDALRAGRPVVVADDADREDEGDLVLAADRITAAWMGFVVRHTSGVICAPMSAARAAELELPPMTQHNQDAKGTAYTVSCDAATGITTGISAGDRARTARTLADPACGAGDLTRPGHLFPLVAAPGGVLERAGHTEAAVELCMMAALEPVGVIAELVHDDGEMMRGQDLRDFATRHDLPMTTVAELRRIRGAQLAAGTPEVTLPTRHGEMRASAHRLDGQEHLLVRSATPTPSDLAPLVRVHSECLTGDVFGSHRCDCGEQLDASLERISREGGALLYLRGHEGRGIGLVDKLRAYALQDGGADTVRANELLGRPAEARDWHAAARILQAHGLDRIRLLTNNPQKVEGLRALGIDVVDQVGLEVPARPENLAYLRTKRDRMHHRLQLGATDPAAAADRTMAADPTRPDPTPTHHETRSAS